MSGEDRPEGDRPPAQPTPFRPGPAPLDYANRPPPLPADDPSAKFLHFAVGMATYWSPLLAMKLAARRFGWDVGAICGSWVCLSAVSFVACSWLGEILGWRTAMAGALFGFVLSLLVNALIVGNG